MKLIRQNYGFYIGKNDFITLFQVDCIANFLIHEFYVFSSIIFFSGNSALDTNKEREMHKMKSSLLLRYPPKTKIIM